MPLLRQCATSWREADSVPNDITQLLSDWPSPSTRNHIMQWTWVPWMFLRVKGGPAACHADTHAIPWSVARDVQGPRRLESPWTFTTCYRDTLTYSLWNVFKTLEWIQWTTDRGKREFCWHSSPFVIFHEWFLFFWRAVWNVGPYKTHTT
jgi:hypothetical protein